MEEGGADEQPQEEGGERGGYDTAPSVLGLLGGAVAREGQWKAEHGEYLRDGRAIALTLPLQAEPFESPVLFPFFAGLVPEGWYLHIVSPTIKVDERDTFGLLIKTCGDCVGAVSVREAGNGQD